MKKDQSQEKFTVYVHTDPLNMYVALTSHMGEFENYAAMPPGKRPMPRTGSKLGEGIRRFFYMYQQKKTF